MAHEALKKGNRDRLNVANIDAQNIQAQGQQDAQLITSAFNGVSQFAQTAISTYAQSEMRKDAPALVKGLRQVADEYNNPDDPEAYQKFNDARKNYIDNYLKDKNAIFRGVFNNDYRAKYEDDAYNYFDEQFTNSIFAKNKTNAIKIMNDSVNAFANGEDLSLFENNTVYKTVADSDGIHVVQEAVELKDTWKTDLPTDTDDFDLNEYNKKQNEFNRLLNIQYSAAALVMGTDQAKEYVTEQIPSIESQAMRAEIFNMAETYMNGIDGNHYTADETKSLMRKQYRSGVKTPYTGRTITAEESANYKSIVDSVVDSVYEEMWDNNRKKLLFDSDGVFASAIEAGIPLTSDVLFPYLEQNGMVELKADGTIKNWYGLDDNTYMEVKRIAENNDRIAAADLIISDKTYWGEDGILDYTDFPSTLQELVIKDANGIWQVSASQKYMTFSDTMYAQSTVNALNSGYNLENTTIDKINALSEFIGWDYNGQDPPTENAVYKHYEELMQNEYGEGWQTNDKITDYDKEVVKTQAFAEAYRELSHYLSLSDDKTLNTYFSAMSDRFKDIVKQKMSETASGELSKEFSDAIDSTSELISANKNYELYGSTDKLIEQARAERTLTDAEEANLDLVAKAQYDKNNLAIDEASEQWYKTAGYSSAKNYRAELESPYKFYELLATQDLKGEVERTYNQYVSDCENIVMFAANGYRLTSDYQYESTGARTANMVFDVSNKNLKYSVKSFLANLTDEEKARFGLDKIDVDNLLTEEEINSINEKYKNEVERDFHINQYEHSKLVSLLSSMTGADAEQISVMFNSNAVPVVQTNLEHAYADFQRDAKGDYRYDSTEITVPTWTYVTNGVNKNIADSVSKYGNFKVATSANGVLTGYMNRVLAGENVNYLKEVARTDPLLSEKDTEKFLNMSNESMFKELSGNPDVTQNISNFIGKFDNQITQSYAWDAMYGVLYDAYYNGKMDDLPAMIQKAKEAFSMAYGERLADDMFEYDENSSVYGTPNFAGRGAKESQATKNKINEYTGAFWAQTFNAAGINAIVNDYMNTQENITLLRAEMEKVSGNEDKMDAYCIWLALDSLGEPVETYNIDYDSDTFWSDLSKYFGRLSKNDKSFDAVYADHVLRIAGSFKASLGIYDKKTEDSIGNVVYADFDKNIFTTASMTDMAVNSGSYISFDPKGSPILHIGDGNGNYSTLDIGFTTEEGINNLETQILKEVNDAAGKDSRFLSLRDFYTNPFNNGIPNMDAIGLTLDDACQALAEMSPTYREYLIQCKQASKYMDLPNNVGKAWYANGGIQFEFVEGNIKKAASDNIDKYNTFESVINDSKKNADYKMDVSLGFGNNLSPEQKEANEAIINFMTGTITQKNKPAEEGQWSKFKREYYDNVVKENMEKIKDNEYNLSPSGIADFLKELFLPSENE